MKPRNRVISLLRQERGSVTIEAALSMMSLVLITSLVLGAMATMGAKLTAIQLASAAARAHAVGIPFEPDVGQVSVEANSGMLVVTAQVPAVLGNMSATAYAPREVAP